MKNRILVFLVIFLLLCTSCSISEEIVVSKGIGDSYIYDEENILDDAKEKELNNMLIELESKTGIEYIVYTTQDLQNKSIETFALELFNKLNVGKERQDNGILFLISRSDNKPIICIGRGLRSYINDIQCSKIINSYFLPYLEKGEYSNAIEFSLQATLILLSNEYDISIGGIDNTIDINVISNSESAIISVSALTIALLFIFFIETFDKNHNKKINKNPNKMVIKKINRI